jgi:putative addiction module killer protein
MEVQPRELQLYLQDDGSSPFDLWLDDLRDNEARSRIRLRLRRVALGNLGDYKPVGEGVYELRLDYGPGYRVYFGQEGNTIVVLLCGGDKRSQNQDITQAKKYWANYENRQSTND